jgi:hypothetical protein
MIRFLLRGGSLAAVMLAVGCACAAAAIVLSSAHPRKKAAHAIRSLPVAINRTLQDAAAAMPSGPPGNPSARATEIAVQADPATATSLGQELGALSWSSEASGQAVAFQAVDPLDNSHVWAVGGACTLLFSGDGGATWTKDTHVVGCSPAATLTGISVLGANGPGWAVGSGGVLLVCSAGCNQPTAAWSALARGSTTGAKDGTLTSGQATAQSASLFGTAAYVGWAITAASGRLPAGTTIVSVNTATKTAALSNAATASTTKDTFTVTAPASAVPVGVDFTSVWGADGNDVYAVGASGGVGRIWACSGSCGSQTSAGSGGATWMDVTPAALGSAVPKSVSGAGTSFVVSAGSGGTVLVCSSSCSAQASGWAALSGAAAPPSSVSFNGVFAADTNDVYAVGDGALWACSARCTQPVASSANAVWGSLATSFAKPALAGVAAQGAGPAWAVGGGGAIWYCPANCTLSGTSWAPVSPPAPTTQPLAAVGLSNANHVWAAGAAGTIVAQLNPTQPAMQTQTAFGYLGLVVTPAVWTGSDGNHVDPTQGGQVFAGTKAAVTALLGIKPAPPSWAVTDMGYLDYAMRLVASTAIADDSCNPQSPTQLAAAQSELGNGDVLFSSGHFDTAIDHYRTAWQDALSAKGVPCGGGLSVAPAGAPTLSAARMVPGDSVDDAAQPVTVAVSGSAANVYLYEDSVSGALLPALHLKIVEDGVSTLYDGPLQSGWTAAAPLSLGSWAAGEQHSFVFKVSMPQSTGNAFQGQSGGLVFVWARS